MKKPNAVAVIAVAVALGFGVYHFIPEPDAQTVGEVLTSRLAVPSNQKLYEMADGTFIVTGKTEALPEAVVADIQVSVKPDTLVVREAVQTENSPGDEQVAQDADVYSVATKLSRTLGREVVLVVQGDSLLPPEYEVMGPVWFALASLSADTNMQIDAGEQAPTLAAAEEWAAANNSVVILIP